MLTIEDYRSMNKGRVTNLERVEISFFDLKNRVASKIREKCLSISLENEDFNRIAETVIRDYIYQIRPFCEGYVKDGHLMIKNLINDLYNSITSWGILTPFKDNDYMRELELNGPNIFIDTSIGYRLFRDPKTNEVIRFTNPDDALEFVKSTLYFSGERLMDETPLVNAATIEGYRVSCTSPVIYPAHPSEPTKKWPTATYRKIGGGVLKREDFINNNTACDLNLRFIELTFQGLLGMVFVGTTGCGKTTLMELGMGKVSDYEKVICIQDPTEYHYRNMVDGVMQNNAMYWEVDPTADPNNPRSATKGNLVTHSLRNTASLLFIGESRDGADFLAVARAQNAGTRVTTSMHSFDIPGTIDRFALELVSQMGIDMEIARELACSYIKTVTLADRIGDKSRKIMGQAEILGYNRKEKSYIINYLFEFIIVDSVPRTGEEGKAGMLDTVGYFVKRNDVSPFFERHMIKTGITRTTLEEFKNYPRNTVIKEINFDKLPEDYVVNYDYNITPLENSTRKARILSKEDSVGIAI